MIDQTMKKLVISVSLWLSWTSMASAQPGAATLTQGKNGCSQCSPPHNQKLAQELFQEAISFLAQAQYKDAAALYEQALTHWDHPLIRYGLARALSLQLRFTEAQTHVAEVLAYGAACFDPRMWENVQKLAAYLRENLTDMGKIEILCRESGAQIDVDGIPGFICTAPVARTQATCEKPEVRVQIQHGWTTTRRGRVSRFVYPGTYHVTASKPGHDTMARPVVVTAGQTSRIGIASSMAAQKRDRPGNGARMQMGLWPIPVPGAREHDGPRTLVPGLLVGAGGATIAVGAVLHIQYREATRGVKASYVMGSTIAATGVAVLLFQYGRDAPRERRDGNGITVLPLLTGDSAGALVDFEF
jgi:hypothetical protein